MSRKSGDMEKLDAAWEEYKALGGAEAAVSIYDLAQKHLIEFKRLEAHIKKMQGKQPEPDSSKTIINIANKRLAQEAENRGTRAWAIGAEVVRGYWDLAELAASKGIKIEEFVKDVFNWYERKTTIEDSLASLEFENRNLQAEAEELKRVADPNFRMALKTEALHKVLKEVLILRAKGVRIPVRAVSQNLEKYLNQVENQASRESNMLGVYE